MSVLDSIVTWYEGDDPITTPGLFDMPAKAYFGNALPEGLSQSSAKVLLEDGGAARFKAAESLPRVEKSAWDIGTAFHALVLGKGAERVKVLDFPNYLSGDAKQAKALAYLDGLTPLLTKDYAIVEEMVAAIPADVMALFTEGRPEVSMLAKHESGLWIRGQIDYLRPDLIVDLKSMDDASLWGFGRSVHKFRYYFQAAIYRRLIEWLTGERLPYLIVGVEKKAPYLTRVMELTDEYLAIGERDMDRAIATYLECVESGIWPGYGNEATPLYPPAWMVADNAQETISALEQLLGGDPE